MKYVGLAVYLEPQEHFWAGGVGCYLLGIYLSKKDMRDVSEYQLTKRVYFDEY